MSEVAPDRNVEAVREALLRRCQHGVEKYGVTTERDDLSPLDWLQHLQEELMDACVYIEALKAKVRRGPIIVKGSLTPEQIVELSRPGAVIAFEPDAPG
jgi:hypothetical protein